MVKWKCVKDRWGGYSCTTPIKEGRGKGRPVLVNLYSDGDMSINGYKVKCRSMGKGKGFMGTTVIWCKTDVSERKK